MLTSEGLMKQREALIISLLPGRGREGAAGWQGGGGLAAGGTKGRLSCTELICGQR